jgi:chromosome segregation ATPase
MSPEEKRARFEESLLNLEKNIQGLAVKCNKLKKENHELKEELANFRNLNAELTKERLARQAELNDLKVQFDKIKNTIIISEKERQTLKSRISDILQRIEVHIS